MAYMLNGRFLTRPLTGVDRTATELVAALMEDDEAGTFPLHCLRPDRPVHDPDSRPAKLLAVTRPSGSSLRGQAWEQIALARAAPDEVLLSLCNLGPVTRRRQVVMIHDAQALTQPQAYSFAFRTWYKVMQRRVGHRAALVLTVSEHSRAELVSLGVAPAERIRVVPNGADHILRETPDETVMTRHGLTPGGYFLAIGSLAPHKNLARLVAAARARSDRSIPLVIAGGGNPGVFSDSGITPSEDVRLLGRVTDAELRALYSNATALAFPSLTEGFGLPPAEAMACGCPVLATTGGAVPEVCQDGAAYADPRDTEAWTALLTRLAADPDLRRGLVDKGTARVARLTWREAARTFRRHLAEAGL